MAEIKFRCKHCWGDDVTEDVKTDGWRSVTDIREETDKDGKTELVFKKGSVEHENDHDHEEFRCEKCEKVAYRLEDLVEQYDAAPRFECRACDWVGSDLADHPLRCPEEPEQIKADDPLPGQESLDVAA